MTDLDEIPPFLRKPERGTRAATEWMLSDIHAKLKKLDSLGLRPHSNLLEYKAELEQQLEQSGPYVLRSRSDWF